MPLHASGVISLLPHSNSSAWYAFNIMLVKISEHQVKVQETDN